MSTNTDRYRKAVAGFDAVIEAFPADKWSASSPCADWTARHVVGHVIGGTQLVSSVETGEAPRFDDPVAAAGDDPAGNYAKARDLAVHAMTEENLAKQVQTPMGEMALDQLIGNLLTGDLLVHTWDLARAAGVDVTLDPGLVEETLQALRPLDQMLRGPNIFGPAVEPPPGADPQTRLICFTGRAI